MAAAKQGMEGGSDMHKRVYMPKHTAEREFSVGNAVFAAIAVAVMFAVMALIA